MMVEGRILTVTVVGRSMEPLLPKGVQVAVAVTPPEELRPGDIVLLETPNGRTIHRMIASASVCGRAVVFHRGDRAGGIGMAEVEVVRGKVGAVLGPSAGAGDRDLTALHRARGIRIATLRCRTYCWVLRGAQLMGPLRSVVPSRIQVLARRMILGP